MADCRHQSSKWLGTGERRGGISELAISPHEKDDSVSEKGRKLSDLPSPLAPAFLLVGNAQRRAHGGGVRVDGVPHQNSGLHSALNLTSIWRALPLLCGASLDPFFPPFFPKGFSLRFRGLGEFGSRSRRSIDGGGAARPPVFGTWFHGGTALAVLSSSSLLAHSLALCISLSLSTSPLRRSLSHNPRSLVRSETPTPSSTRCTLQGQSL